MIVDHENNVQAKTLSGPEIKGAAIKVLVGETQGWTDHVMRIIELEEKGHSPWHTHPWPHINYMLEGKGVLLMEGQEYAVETGSYAYVPSGKEHQFRNTGTGKFRFICIVPKEGHQ